MSTTPPKNCSPVSTTPPINFSVVPVLPILACLHLNMKISKLQYLGVKCTKLSSEQNMKKNFISKFFSFFAGVADTADKHLFPNISANFRKNSKWSYWNTQGPRGHWFMKKTWSRKSRVRLPLTLCLGKISSFLCSTQIVVDQFRKMYWSWNIRLIGINSSFSAPKGNNWVVKRNSRESEQNCFTQNRRKMAVIKAFHRLILKVH